METEESLYSGLQYAPGLGAGGRPTPHPKKGKFFVQALHSEGWAETGSI